MAGADDQKRLSQVKERQHPGSDQRRIVSPLFRRMWYMIFRTMKRQHPRTARRTV